MTDERTILPGTLEGLGITVHQDLQAQAGWGRAHLAEGTEIGAFRVVRLLGEGGFGVVYEAEQRHPVRRTVALKLLKPGVGTAEVLARFDAERQALARMEHPCVAKVLDAGTTADGRPYFAMEFVRGEPILAFADRERLDLPGRIRLAIRVCDAVQHAHAKGVVHRDLKPANVLCMRAEGGALPKVIDFGIAKAMAEPLSESTVATIGGALLGTPDYMAPEQADGLDVDTRADVYSLGVTLYELLSGLLPFDPTELRAHGIAAMRRTIVADVPQRPSDRLAALGRRDGASAALIAGARSTDVRSLVRALHEDLDWICMRCLEKDRERRYGSPGDLAADLGRHLRREPVEAGPPSRAYVARRFVARHRLGVSAAAAFVLTLAAGAGTFAWLYREADSQRRRAGDALDALQRSISEADPSQGGRATATMGALDFLVLVEDQLGQRLAAQPDALASMRSALGSARLSFKDSEGAQRIFEQVVAERRAEAAAGAIPGADRALGDALHNLGRSRYYAKRFDEARGCYEEALSVRRALHADADHADVAMTLQHLAAAERQLGNLDRAMELIDASVAMWTRLDPGSRERFQAINNRGTILEQAGRIAEAEHDYAAALAVIERKRAVDDPLVARAAVNLARARLRLGRPSEAVPLLERAESIYLARFGESHADTASAREELARARSAAQLQVPQALSN